MSSSPTETGSQLAQVTMPQMGVSVAEGTIVEWRKRPGDWVEADETVCDVTTDKIDVEIPSPATGRLERILVEPGDTVAVGTLIAEIDAEARPGEAHPDEHNGRQPQGGERPAPSAAEAAAEDGDRSSFYSPVVRRIADKHGVDLAQVSGTGIGGAFGRRTCSHTSRLAKAFRPRLRSPPFTPSPPTGRRRWRRRNRARPGARQSQLHRPALRLRRSTSCSGPRAPSRCPRCARRSPGT